MVLNYINEKLLERASFYIIHICAYFIFLLLLSSYIFGKTDFQDIFATLFLIVFGFGLVSYQNFNFIFLHYITESNLVF